MSGVWIAIVLACYFAALTGISLFASAKSSTNADFFRGGRKSPWYVVAIAMVGTSISGVTFVSVPGMVAASQFSYLQMALGFVAGYVVIAYVLLPLFYKLNLNSLYAYLETRFGRRSYNVGAGFFLLSKVLGCGVRLYLSAVVLQLVLFEPLGVPFGANVALTMFILWLYSFRGGVKSLVWTDMLQTLCLVTTVVLCIFNMGRSMGLDFGGICSSIADSSMSRIWFFDDAMDKRYFWKQFLAGMFTTVAMTGLDQDMMQKNLSCKSLKDSRRNVLSYGVAFIPVNFLFLSLGVLLYHFAAQSGISVAAPDDLFPTVACGRGVDGVPFMPPVVSLLFCLGLAAASFSSGGSALCALTTTFTLDVMKADRRMDEDRLRRTRMTVHLGVAVVIGLVIYSLRLIGNGSVINAIYTIAGYTYGPLLGLFFFGIFTRRSVRDAWVPYICIASPVICWILSTHSAQWFGGYQIGFELLLINAGITMLGLWVSNVYRKSSKA